MHAHILIFTHNIPSNDRISELLTPYCEWNDDRNESAAELYLDGWTLGGRYSGSIEAKVATIKPLDDGGYIFETRNINQAEIRSQILDYVDDYFYLCDKRWAYIESVFFLYMLTENHAIKVDGAYLKNVVNELHCWGYISDSGDCICRDYHESDFDDMLSEIMAKYKDLNGFVTSIDIHF